jgi:HEAT repeat protein
VPYLVKQLKSKDASIRGAAARRLAAMRVEMKAAVSTLVEILKDGEVRYLRLAAETLGKIGPEAREAIRF